MVDKQILFLVSESNNKCDTPSVSTKCIIIKCCFLSSRGEDNKFEEICKAYIESLGKPLTSLRDRTIKKTKTNRQINVFIWQYWTIHHC
jgi:hypothetical protein